MAKEPFPKNQWYVAATAAELTEGRALARTVCGQPLVMFRTAAGAVAVLEDRCPHRKFPLSAGTVTAGELQCGYHGLRFDGTGRCTLIPSQSEIPKSLHARAYPAVERCDLVFVWMGDPVTADPKRLPDLSHNTRAGWTAIHGYNHVAANYMLLVDNLLDLTHLPFLHKTTLAGPGIVENPLTVDATPNMVRARRFMPDVDAAPIHRVIRPELDKIDRCQTLEFRPPIYVHVILGARPAGSGEDIDDPTHVVLNSLTPETERTTHYFWSVARWRGAQDAQMSATLRDIHIHAFGEDIAAIELQQKMIDSDPAGGTLLNLDGDKASVFARRMVKRLIDDEAAAAAAA
jgi:phenylpropionate dioxygenase-like ring-hydroxylating dioxygenase large terminal subunit